MSQLNFYVPDLVEKKIRAAAKKKGVSVSAFVAELVKKEISAEAEAPFGKKFFDLAGSWEGDFPELSRKKPQRREGL